MRCLFLLLLITWSIANGQVPPCDLSIDCCEKRCGDKPQCRCECLFATGQALRAQEDYPNAIKYLKAAIPGLGRNVQAVIDSIIYLEHRIWVKEDGPGDKFAIANTLGELVEKDRPYNPYRFTNPQSFSKGVAIFSENEKYFFVDKDGLVLTPIPGYEAVIQVEGGFYYLVEKNTFNYCSLTTESGLHPAYWLSSGSHYPFFLSELCPWKTPDSLRLFFDQILKYEYVRSFYNDLAIVKKDGKFGLIDKMVRKIIDTQYQGIGIFQKEVIWIKKDEKWGLINKNGQKIITPQYEEVEYFQGALTKVKKEGKWGLVDQNGHEIIIPQYSHMEHLTDGIAKVKKDKQVGLVDQSGREFVAPQYEDIGDFQEGVAWIQKDNKLGFIDESGREIVSPQYQDVGGFSEGIARVKTDGKWGLINRSGHETVAPEYEDVGDFRDGVIWVQKNGASGLINRSSRKIDLPTSSFEEAEGDRNAKLSVTDQNGQKIIAHTLPYEEVSSFQQGVARVKRDGKWGLIDKSGREVVAPQYQEIEAFQDSVAMVKREGKWGFMEQGGREIVAPQYEEVRAAFTQVRSQEDWEGVLRRWYSEDLPGCAPDVAIHRVNGCVESP